MARTFLQAGKLLPFTNNTGSDISSGDVVVMGDMVGVAMVDIPAGSKGTVSVEGVHRLKKAAGSAWAQGDKLSWDDGAKAFTNNLGVAASGDVQNCAVAAAPAAAPATEGEVKLTPGTGSGA